MYLKNKQKRTKENPKYIFLMTYLNERFTVKLVLFFFLYEFSVITVKFISESHILWETK